MKEGGHQQKNTLREKEHMASTVTTSMKLGNLILKCHCRKINKTTTHVCLMVPTSYFPSQQRNTRIYISTTQPVLM